ncbi:MAG: iron chelate uptake ABC transporter family permease subunit [Phaeodactylibacter sp.]|uniref:metal ABC transporter permease n=1 Tax=Phaeodactylibacter sp. TaxID=1940289 RepID=UPI0032EFCD39
MSDFFTFSDPNVRMVTAGTVLLGVSAAIVGTFTFLRKRALVGDAIAHAVLPGVCLAFIVTGDKHPAYLLVGAVIAGWVSLLAMDYLTSRTKLSTDTAIGAVLSVFFGAGILLLTSIQHSGSANQAGLDKFLFGKAASMTRQDIWVFSGVAMVLLSLVLAFFRAFKLVSFDPAFAHSIGLPVRQLEFLLSTITVLAVATGIQAVGVVLMAALLITPAAAARFWTDRIQTMLLLAAVFGFLSGVFGSWISYTAPAMPTGPWIVVLLSVIALFSIVAAPERGIWARIRLQRGNTRKILLENILKAFYSVGEAAQTFTTEVSLPEIQEQRPFEDRALRKGLRRLQRRGLLENKGTDTYTLTPAGLKESRRVVRLHRLWELYLTERMNFAADHVHNTAEAIEHVITPEVEAALLKELGHPILDPHDSVIPYPNPQKPTT